jgi:hypothetical protein
MISLSNDEKKKKKEGRKKMKKNWIRYFEEDQRYKHGNILSLLLSRPLRHHTCKQERMNRGEKPFRQPSSWVRIQRFFFLFSFFSSSFFLRLYIYVYVYITIGYDQSGVKYNEMYLFRW